jgi:hypothetical protein
MDWMYEANEAALWISLSLDDLWRLQDGWKVWGPAAATHQEASVTFMEFAVRPAMAPDSVCLVSLTDVLPLMPVPPQPADDDWGADARRARIESYAPYVSLRLPWPPAQG